MKTLLIAALFTLVTIPSMAAEDDIITNTTASIGNSAEEGGGAPRVIKNTGSLKKFVKSNLGIVQHRLGNQWIIDKESLECVSEEMRGDKAGACIVNAKLFGDKESIAMYAILVGEEDENGGISVRKIEFLKQSN